MYIEFRLLKYFLAVAREGNITKHGLDYSLVIQGSVPFIDNTNICYRPLSPKLTASSFIVWKRYQPFSLATKKFIEYTKHFFNTTKL